jgi:hypothetical protein
MLNAVYYFRIKLFDLSFSSAIYYRAGFSVNVISNGRSLFIVLLISVVLIVSLLLICRTQKLGSLYCLVTRW